MASYVKFELEDGTFVFIETTELPRGASGLIPGREHPAELPAASFEKSVLAIRKMASVMVQHLRDGFPEQPEEVQINFGLKAAGDVNGLVVARGGSEANFGVLLRWSSESSKGDSEGSSEDEKKGKGEKKEGKERSSTPVDAVSKKGVTVDQDLAADEEDAG